MIGSASTTIPPCFSVGAVGSLIAAQLSKTSNQAVRLILRDGRAYNDLLRQNREITIERDGQQLVASDIDIELIPPVRIPTAAQTGHPFVSDKLLQAQRSRDAQRQSLGPIDSLFVTTKAPAVLPAIQQLLPRLRSDSTIVLLQNGGGIVDSLINNVFPDESLRPNFVIGVNTHGSYLKAARTSEGSRSASAMHTVWAGVGNIPFGVLPNLQNQQFLEERGLWTGNPMTNSLDRQHPNLERIPASHVTQTLRTTIASMLTCQPLNFEWLSLPELLRIQQQKIAINCVINPLTAIFDVQNGVLVDQDIAPLAYSICREVGRVFAEHARRELAGQTEAGHKVVQEDDAYLLEHGGYPRGHPLNSEALYARAMQVARITDANVSSTLADVRRGIGHTEIDFMNGYVSKLGYDLGIPTPVNDSLVHMVKFKAQLGRRAQRQPPGTPRNLAGMRISDRYGATYKPEGIKVRHKKRRSQDAEATSASEASGESFESAHEEPASR